MIKLLLSLCLIMYSHSILAMDSAPPTATKLIELQTSLQTLQTKLTDLSGYLTILRLRIQQHPLVEYFDNDIPTMLFHRSFINFICNLETTWDVGLENFEITGRQNLSLTLKNNPLCVVYFGKNYTEPNIHTMNFSPLAYTNMDSKILIIETPGLTEPGVSIIDSSSVKLTNGLSIIASIAKTTPTQSPVECFCESNTETIPDKLKTLIQFLVKQNWIPSFKIKNATLGQDNRLFFKKNNFCIIFEDSSNLRTYQYSIAFNTTTEETPLKIWEFIKKPLTPEDNFTLEEIENEKTTKTTFDAIQKFINQELTKGT